MEKLSKRTRSCLLRRGSLCFSMLLLCVLILLPQVSSAQRITLKFNAKLSNILTAIEQQAEVNFAYSPEVIDINRVVAIDVRAETLDKTLKMLFEGSDVTYTISNKRVYLSLKKRPQPTSAADKSLIEGVVTDEKGEPVIGATIIEVGTTNGVTSSFDGTFSLTRSKEAPSLQVSFLGYQTVVVSVADQQSRVSIVLSQDDIYMDEIVVVGYGTQKKANLTGATATLSAKALADRPVASVGQALQGAMPNLNITFSGGRPGQGASYNVRGNTSPNGGSPLILVDGVETNPDRINSNDIESVTVLKDAASAAIYGARASFGVILITTKSGQSEQTQVSYSGRFSISQRTTSTEFETRGYYHARIADFFSESRLGVPYTTYTPSDYKALWERRNDQTEHPDRPWVISEQRNGRTQYLYLANFDWYNYLYDDSRPTHDHNISISGGSKKMSYLISGRYYSQQGVYRTDPDDFTSYNMRAKIKAELTPWLTISNNTKYYSGKYSYMGSSSLSQNFNLAGVHALASIVPINPDGTAVSHTTTAYSSTHFVMDGYNAMLQKGKSRGANQTQEFSTMFEVDFKLHENLHVKADFNYTLGYLNNFYRSVKVDYSMYPGEVLQESDSSYPDSYQEMVNDQRYYVADVYANYQKRFGQHHNFSAVAGYNYEAKYLKDVTAERRDLLSEDLNDFNLATGNITALKGGQNQYAIMGLFARVTYNYAGKYLVEFNGRYDGTSRFPRDQRFGFFPSASMAYRISEEAFFEPLRKVVSNLKLRFSYGSLGNQQIGYYDYIQNVSTKGNIDYTFDGINLAPQAIMDNPVASNLTWEKVISKNIGIDLSLFDHRLEMTADWYIRDTKGILSIGKSLPSFYGAKEPLVNANNMRTRGYELSMRWNDSFQLAGKPFGYSIGASLSDYEAFYTKCDNPSGLLSDPYIGRRMGEIWGYSVDGLFASDEQAAAYAAKIDLQSVCKDYFSSVGAYGKGVRAGDMRYLDLDGDNAVNSGTKTLSDHGDMRVIGNSQPRYSYGINLGFNWYNFDVSAFGQGIGRMNWYPDAGNVWFWGPYARQYGTFMPSNFMSEVWSEENPNTYFPRARANCALNGDMSLTTINDRYMQDLAYFRLKNLTVGYTIPQQLTSRLRISKLRIYFSGENLFTLSKMDNKFVDPEQAASGVSKSNAYPFCKTYSFGINLNF